MSDYLFSQFVVLQFTPEVTAGIQAAANLAFGPVVVAEQSEMDLERIALEMMRRDPDLVKKILELGAEQFKTA